MPTFSLEMCLLEEMQNSMKFHIPEPCHEKWDEMTPTEKGAFCQKCALEVMDFTKKSSYEIRDILTEKYQNKERSCGHITQRQLNEVNDIGFYWKNEQHRFQSVWMVSLLAVFGLTLFSCQNTFTKEMVSEMEEKANVLLEEEETISEPVSDESTTASNDSVTNVSIADIPNIDVPYDGLVSLKPQEESVAWCDPIIMGDFVELVGTFLPLHEDKELTWIDLKAQFGEHDNRTVEGFERIAPQPRKNIGNRADMVYNIETDDFIAYISPAPAEVTSQLIVESFDDIELYISLENAQTLHQYTNKSIEIKEGVHTFDLNLDKLQAGSYRIQLQTWKTLQTLEFWWEGLEKESV